MHEKPSKGTTKKPQSTASERSSGVAERVDSGLLYEIKKERTQKER
jgi:hypothetical protein